MNIIKGCIFDLDGVIVDTAKYHYLAWKRLSAELGFDFTEKDNERLKGVSRMVCMEILVEIGGLSLSEDEKHFLADKKNSWYVEYISGMGEEEILPGTREFITRIKAAGIKTALGSASKNAGIILANLRLLELFDAIIDGTCTTKAKPDPEVFLLGAKALNLPAHQCVVAANNAGMLCVGVGSADILTGTDFIIRGFDSNLDDILNALIVQ